MLQGSGRCPFGNKCFYKHALADGQIIDVGEPPRPERHFNWDDVFLFDSDDYDSEFLDYF